MSVAVGFIMMLSYGMFTAVGLGLCTFVFLQYVNSLNRTLPVLELMLFISALQWIFGAHQAFNFEFQHYKYYMYVEREPYMFVVVPGFLAFMLGVLLVKKKLDILEVNHEMEQFVAANPKAPIWLVIFGFVTSVIGAFMPPSLQFVFFLLGNLKFIGVALWLFKPQSTTKWVATAAILGITLISSIRVGMFHDLLLWLAMLFSFVALKTGMTISRRLILITGGFLMAFLIQSVKEEFRQRLYSGALSGQSVTEVFFEMIQDKMDNLGTLFGDDEYMAEMNVRLNQGWIISAIIENVPEYEPYAAGSTIEEAFVGALLPRFLVPNKKVAGGRENFERFTGLPLGEGTSMGTSVIGEAYANFGAWGSWIFMFFWGLFLSLGFNKLVSYGKKNPLMYIFLPLIFLQVVKAETELYVVLNHFVKSIILVFILMTFFKKYLGWKLDSSK